MKNGYKWRNMSLELGNYHGVHCKKMISLKLKAMALNIERGDLDLFKEVHLQKSLVTHEVTNNCWWLYLKRKHICFLSGHGIMTKWYSTFLKNWAIRWNGHLSFK